MPLFHRSAGILCQPGSDGFQERIDHGPFSRVTAGVLGNDGYFFMKNFTDLLPGITGLTRDASSDRDAVRVVPFSYMFFVDIPTISFFLQLFSIPSIQAKHVGWSTFRLLFGAEVVNF